jgi:hypothetical protein
VRPKILIGEKPKGVGPTVPAMMSGNSRSVDAGQIAEGSAAISIQSVDPMLRTSHL